MNQQMIDEVKNITILKSLLKTENVLSGYSNVAVSVSGGADSDVVVDIISKCDLKIKPRYIFFNTGLEYKATFDQLDYLEKKYDIEIERLKVKQPIPLSIKKKGQPFMSKFVSAMISRLQSHNFKWEDKPFDILYKEYPNCKSALRWWCNDHAPSSCIVQNKFLKQFMIANPPEFKISDYCCKGAKKDPSNEFVKANDIDLMITGVRKAEGGSRKTAYNTCHSEKIDKVDMFMPILWYVNDDKREYEKEYNIENSMCYSCYGLKRTGCAGCPFGKEFEFELEVLKEHEPKLYIAASNMFKDSYEYHRKYYRFRKQMEKDLDPQMDMYDFLYDDYIIREV